MNTRPFTVKGIGVTTPKGEALWCNNVEPQRKFNDKGDLVTSLLLDPEDTEVKDFIRILEELRDKAYAETVKEFGKVKGEQVKKRDVYQPDADKEGNATGKILIKLKLRDVDIKRDEGKQHTITTFDAKKNPIKNPPRVGNGSIIRCSAFANPYYMASTKEVGVSLIWTKMQIINLVEIGGGDDFGEEEGYEVGSFETEEAPF